MATSKRLRAARATGAGARLRGELPAGGDDPVGQTRVDCGDATVRLPQMIPPSRRRPREKAKSSGIVHVEIHAHPAPTIPLRVRLRMALLYLLAYLYRRTDGALWSLGRLFHVGTDDEPALDLTAVVEPDASVGPILAKEDAPSLFRMIKQLTKWMDVRPSEIRLSHLPTCGVLDLADATGRPRKVLIIGLPCLKVWTIGEVLSVLGHELAHLKLEDAVFTREILQFGNRLLGRPRPMNGRFSPRFLLARAVGSVLVRLATPVSRSMEFRADRWSADCFGADHLGSALEKLAIVQPLFHEILHTVGDRDGEIDNVYDFFGRAWERLPAEQYEYLRQHLVDNPQLDPSDPHPPISDRLARLRVERPATKPGRTSALELLADPAMLMQLLHNHLFRPSLRPSTRNRGILALIRESRVESRESRGVGRNKAWRSSGVFREA